MLHPHTHGTKDYPVYTDKSIKDTVIEIMLLLLEGYLVGDIRVRTVQYTTDIFTTKIQKHLAFVVNSFDIAGLYVT